MLQITFLKLEERPIIRHRLPIIIDQLITIICHRTIL